MEFKINDQGEIIQKGLYGNDIELSLEEFIRDLKRHMNPVEEKGRLLTAGYTGGNVIASGIYENRPDMSRMIIEYPPCRRNLETDTLRDGSPLVLDVGCPRTIVSVTIKAECLSNIYVFTALNNGKEIDSDTILFKFPFGNVFGSGSLCTGFVSLQLSDYEGLSITEIVEHVLYGTLFNNHLTGGEPEYGIPMILHHSGEDFNDDYLNKPLTTAGALLI